MSIRRSRRIQDLTGADFERGKESERKVEEALRDLAVSGDIDHHYRAEPKGELDRQGIDFLVYPEPDWMIPLQVKSSAWGKEEHINIYGSRIPCVVVDHFSVPSELSEVILQELGLSVKFLEPILEPVL